MNHRQARTTGCSVRIILAGVLVVALAVAEWPARGARVQENKRIRPARLVVLTRHGITVRELPASPQISPNSAGEAERIPGTENVETTSACPSSSHVIGTRGREVWLFALAPGTRPTLLLKHHSSVRFAVLSPDTRLLAFSSESYGKWRIWIAERIDPTSQPSTAPERAGDEPHAFSNARPVSPDFGYDPSFSADGRSLFFEHSGGGLARVDLASGKVQPFLADLHPKAHSVRCSPDGRYVSFSENRAIWLHELRAGETRRLTDGASYDRFPSFLGDEVAFYRQPRTSAASQPRVTSASITSVLLDGGEEQVIFQGEPLLVHLLPAAE